jgi:hypothetical protein
VQIRLWQIAGWIAYAAFESAAVREMIVQKNVFMTFLYFNSALVFVFWMFLWHFRPDPEKGCPLEVVLALLMVVVPLAVAVRWV